MSHHYYSGPDFSFPHGDARVYFTDLYAFQKPADASKSILIMNVHPSGGENPPGPKRKGDERQSRGPWRRVSRFSLSRATSQGSIQWASMNRFPI
jgi:hypothetical protein